MTSGNVEGRHGADGGTGRFLGPALTHQRPRTLEQPLQGKHLPDAPEWATQAYLHNAYTCYSTDLSSVWTFHSHDRGWVSCTLPHGEHPRHVLVTRVEAEDVEAPTQEDFRGYEVRCWRTDAHAPHDHIKEDQPQNSWWCPGMKAHPDTMIGRQG